MANKGKRIKCQPPSQPQPKPPQQPNWAEIPTDALDLVFQKLGAAQVLVSAQRVCRSWRQLSLDPTAQHWRCIDMAFLPQNISWPSADHLPQVAVDHSGGRVQTLRVAKAYDGFLTHIAGRTTMLRSLSLFWVVASPGVVAHLLSQCPLLEELRIGSNDISAQEIADIGRSCPKLTCFRLDGRFRYPNSDTDCESDKKSIIDAGFIFEVDEDDYSDTDSQSHSINPEAAAYNILDSDSESHYINPKAAAYNIFDSDTDEPDSPLKFYSDAIALEIANNMPQLRKLRFARFGISSKGLHAILDKCHHLQSLDLRSCSVYRVDDALQAKLDKIKTLKLS